ncbi:NAD-dependent dihydropyrimidine dehydrogenase PreA subunit [Methanohalophilus levihalophilus]|uniref:4Fe-4S dicluster domain-containing protein n=1 Tax=Methanohalophilus levihalophilus TaxID=1431282 RepID=UPI001AE7F957|nr:ferredoxin family protein [Methanohalophilus levihalophilus]MBP2031116.1 NAD-dependent dihydropyrimidine dehydrogenase PreA subunit [Methanohalophilus levihalophilus]
MPPIVDEDRCTGVGACAEICPTEVIDLETKSEGKTIAVIARPEDCTECEQCVNVCPEDAISME